MKTISTVFVVALCLGTPASTALAAGWDFMKDTPSEVFTREDWDIFNAAYKRFLNEGKDGETANWSNPATTAKGTLTLVKTSENKGITCRTLRIANQARNRKDATNMTFCKQPDGDWKVPGSSTRNAAAKPPTAQ